MWNESAGLRGLGLPLTQEAQQAQLNAFLQPLTTTPAQPQALSAHDQKAQESLKRLAPEQGSPWASEQAIYALLGITKPSSPHSAVPVSAEKPIEDQAIAKRFKKSQSLKVPAKRTQEMTVDRVTKGKSSYVSKVGKEITREKAIVYSSCAELYDRTQIFLKKLSSSKDVLLQSDLTPLEKSFIHHVPKKKAVEFLEVLGTMAFQANREDEPYFLFDEFPHNPKLEDNLKKTAEHFKNPIVRALIQAKFCELVIRNDNKNPNQLKAAESLIQKYLPIELPDEVNPANEAEIQVSADNSVIPISSGLTGSEVFTAVPSHSAVEVVPTFDDVDVAAFLKLLDGQ